jgi:hypothetical protein
LARLVGENWTCKSWTSFSWRINSTRFLIVRHFSLVVIQFHSATIYKQHCHHLVSTIKSKTGSPTALHYSSKRVYTIGYLLLNQGKWKVETRIQPEENPQITHNLCFLKLIMNFDKLFSLIFHFWDNQVLLQIIFHEFYCGGIFP